ncbi:MAG: monovalent cation/H(+) antiporter subunit G [archaeon]
MLEYLLWLAAFFMFSGAIGMLRFPDVYNRIHSSTLITVGGAMLGIFVLAIKSYPLSPQTSIKMLLLIALLILTSPVSSHAIANAAYKSGIKPVGVKRSAPA